MYKNSSTNQIFATMEAEHEQCQWEQELHRMHELWFEPYPYADAFMELHQEHPLKELYLKYKEEKEYVYAQ